jgi:DNA (cytosine-5)-methyltransferase 1
MKRKHPYSAVSLYSGAGGLDAGFSRFFDIALAIDRDRFAVETYNRNLEPVAVCGDVLKAELPRGLKPDLVVGGPPCQGFSVIGRMDPQDPRSKGVEHFLDVVGDLQPRAFVMENVKALATNARWAPIRENLLERASELGYQSQIFVVNAFEFGVPQARERMFLIGFKETAPRTPEPRQVRVPATVRTALGKLPPVGAPGNDDLCSARVVLAKKPVLRPSAYSGSLLFNGSGRPLQLDGPAKTLPASMGGNATPIIDQDELESGAEPWVVRYHQRLRAGGTPLKRTPARLRRITIQEAAVLQTFPIGWEFAGSQVAKYRQIGNAVPPMLAEAVARMVRSTLDDLDARSRPAAPTITRKQGVRSRELALK